MWLAAYTCDNIPRVPNLSRFQGGEMQRQDEPEVNLEQILERGRAFFGRFKIGGGGGSFAYIVLGLMVLGVAAWAATGFYTVQPGEEAVLRQFGKFNSLAGPGLHWFWPSPVGTRSIIQADERRRLELGFRGNTPAPAESLMITGDENIVDVEMVVLYRISSIRKFVLNVRDPGELDRGIGDRPDGRTLKDVAEVSLRGVIGQRPIDDVLTAERGIIEQEVKDNMVYLLGLYKTGILVEQVQLQTVRAPDQVQAAFDDVVSAKEDKERLDNEAQAYAADIVPRARGNAERVLNEALAFEAQRVNEAQGRAAEFLAVLEEYSKSPDITRERLYLEAMEEILPGITKFIVSEEAGGGLLQFLPLAEGTPSSTQPGVNQP